jgi:hypothetical protein
VFSRDLFATACKIHSLCHGRLHRCAFLNQSMYKLLESLSDRVRLLACKSVSGCEVETKAGRCSGAVHPHCAPLPPDLIRTTNRTKLGHVDQVCTPHPKPTRAIKRGCLNHKDAEEPFAPPIPPSRPAPGRVFFKITLKRPSRETSSKSPLPGRIREYF